VGPENKPGIVLVGRNVRYYEDDSWSEGVSLVAEAKQLLTTADLDGLLAESAEQAVLVFKHSTT
jgi:hypothetical protein